jgi:hypothetical protein
VTVLNKTVSWPSLSVLISKEPIMEKDNCLIFTVNMVRYVYHLLYNK